MVQATHQDSFEWNWRTCFFTYSELWQRDKLFVVMFIVVNLVLGQVGVIASLFFAADSPTVHVLSVLASNLESAALYTFAITLLTGSLAGLAIEMIDKHRKNEVVFDFEYKMFWFFIALLLVVFQSTVAGNLIAKASVTSSVNVPAATRFTSTGIAHPLALPGDYAAEPPVESPESAQVKSSVVLSVGFSPLLQIVLWILSMITAFELYCLQRRELTPENFAGKRKKDVADLAAQAQHAGSTSFGEQI